MLVLAAASSLLVVTVIVIVGIVIIGLLLTVTKDAKEGTNVFENNIQDFPKVGTIVSVVSIAEYIEQYCGGEW